MSVRVPDSATVAEAAKFLGSGGLVVLPTETVYGLAADAANEMAVRSIFIAKGRPSDNPVIVHCRDLAHAQAVSGLWPPGALELAKRFWPGPLTLVVPRSNVTAPACSAGLDTVALRVPAHTVFQQVLRASGLALAAPSANVSGRPSPTRAADAAADLGDSILILDGGPCAVGLESSVVGWPDGRPTLLRQGGVPVRDLEAIVGPLANAAPGDRPLAPGMKYRHYAPATPLRVVAAAALRSLWEVERRRSTRTAWLVSTESGLRGPDVTVIASRHDAAGWARRLFAALRDADAGGYDTLVVEAIPEAGLGAAVMERLRKAASS
ncbi:MAG: L-threonylcarbamoyladenylate synthase [Candidatus Thermoplasmatota archaeon]